MNMSNGGSRSTAALVLLGTVLGCSEPGHRSELRHFRKSINLRNDAVRIAAGEKIPRATKAKTMIKKLEECLAETQLVSDKALASLHPELPSRYRNEFCKGVKLAKTGLEQLSTAKNSYYAPKGASLTMKEGDDLLERFGDWYEGAFSR